MSQESESKREMETGQGGRLSELGESSDGGSQQMQLTLILGSEMKGLIKFNDLLILK